VNAHYLRAASDGELLERIEAILPEIDGGPVFAAKLDDPARQRLLALMPLLKERARTLVELLQSARFLVAARPVQLDERASAVLDGVARERLGRLARALAGTPWTTADLEAAVRSLAEAEGIKLGQLAQPLRAALTGSASSPPIFDVLAALGREESLARLSDQAA
jgi:glutamyl-tRNA synthetase